MYYTESENLAGYQLTIERMSYQSRMFLLLLPEKYLKPSDAVVLQLSAERGEIKERRGEKDEREEEGQRD